MPAIRNLGTALSITATGIQPGIRLNRSPQGGGSGREGIIQLAAAIGGAGVVLIQGHPSPNREVPASGDAAWATLLTLNAASKLRQELADLPYHIRVNVSVIGTGTVTIDLEGTP